MSKGIAVHAIFLIAVIVMVVLFSIGILFNWINTTNTTTTAVTCAQKKIGYCAEWQLKGPGNCPDTKWSDKDPKNCDSVGITQPKCSDCFQGSQCTDPNKICS